MLSLMYINKWFFRHYLIKPVNFTTFAARPVIIQLCYPTLAGSGDPAFLDGLALATKRPGGLTGV